MKEFIFFEHAGKQAGQTAIRSCFFFRATTGACFFSLFIFYSLNAQQTITTSEFLSTVFDDQIILHQERELDFLKNTDYEMPWADELEFRTETDEMDLDRQEYLMRFRYNTKKERRAERDLYRSEIRLQEIEKTILLEEALMGRYFLLVKYIFLQREINLLKQQQLVADDKLNVLRKKAAALADVDLNDVLATEERNHNLELDLFKSENELEQLKKIISTQFYAGQNRMLDTTGFISFLNLKDRISQLPKDPDANYVFNKRQIGLEQNQLEYEKELADNSWKIDYVQFKHAGRDNLSFAREWAFGMGVEIPLKTAGKIQYNDILFDRIEQENRIEAQKKELTQELQKKYDALELKIKEHDLVVRQMSNSQLQYSFENYPQYKDADPLILLNIQSNLLQRQEDQLEIEQDVFELYLDIIELSGKSVELPLRNYLHEDWELINN